MRKYAHLSIQLSMNTNLKKKIMYKIYGSYKGRSFELIDTAKKVKEALELSSEYRRAFKADWEVVIKHVLDDGEEVRVSFPSEDLPVW